MNTPVVKSVWTKADDALLAELTERKKRIMEENRHPLMVITGQNYSGQERDDLVDFLIDNAAAVRDALLPWDDR